MSGGIRRGPIDDKQPDAFSDRPEETPTGRLDPSDNISAAQIELLYDSLAQQNNHMTKGQVLAIDLTEYDRIRTFPTHDGTDWQLMRDRMLFLQTAVRAGFLWSEVATRTAPHFGRVLSPPFRPVCQTFEPSAYQPPTYDQSRHTPAEWAREATEGWSKHRDQLLELIQGPFDELIESGELRIFARRRVARQSTRKAPIIDEQTAHKMAASRFFRGTAWSDLANEYPPKKGYQGAPPVKAKQKRRRANQIRMRVDSLLQHLGLPPDMCK